MTGNIKTLNPPVLVLAAGLSERMGTMKPLLKFDEKDTFLSHIIAEYEKFGSKEIIVVTNEKVVNVISETVLENIKIILNKNPLSGRLGSIKLGLKALKTKGACFIHNTDNPFVNSGLLMEMASMSNDENYIVPVFKGKGGPPILIGRKAIEHVNSLKQADADLREILKSFERINAQTTDERILYNMNTMEDYNKYFKK